ncbi:MAG: dihydrodipicolinate synthase family protein [Rhizobiaceae bacterium]|nr:dihydrodipicolinate synthase family protein [Rhizobiaceae bacterium]
MNETTRLPTSVTAAAFSSGVIASTLTPFSETGSIETDAITHQAHRLAKIDGILGIAVNTTIREREVLGQTERTQIIRRTREALGPDQLLLACVGALSDDVADEVRACAEVGANAVITFPPSWRDGSGAPALEDHLAQLKACADGLSLPIIAAIGDGHRHPNGNCPELARLARDSRQIIGVDMGIQDNVLHYDQAYYALKTIDRPLACLPSSEAALFHNLNTGADGVISCLAYVAPHEVSALYRATKAGLTHEAQALHNKLAPLIALISGRDKLTREMVLRQIAHSRGLLLSTGARGVSRELDPATIQTIERTLDEIALTPIKWVYPRP